MSSERRFRFHRLALLAGLACLVATGCGGSTSPDQALDSALKEAGMTKDTIYPLSGKVLIDGQPPHFEKPADRLLVILNDPQKLDVPAMDKMTATVNHEGEFAFTTYKKDDGVKAGKYIVTFAFLHRHGKKGLLGPDDLKNLYNDPDKNDKVPEFVIDQQKPGKTDYVFNLQLAGKEPGTPGPHAVTQVTDKGMKR